MEWKWNGDGNEQQSDDEGEVYPAEVGRKDVSGSASAGPRHEDYLTVREDRHHRRQGRVTAKGSAECARIER